jgi:hypothetical protein
LARWARSSGSWRAAWCGGERWTGPTGRGRGGPRGAMRAGGHLLSPPDNLWDSSCNRDIHILDNHVSPRTLGVGTQDIRLEVRLVLRGRAPAA